MANREGSIGATTFANSAIVSCICISVVVFDAYWLKGNLIESFYNLNFSRINTWHAASRSTKFRYLGFGFLGSHIRQALT